MIWLAKGYLAFMFLLAALFSCCCAAVISPFIWAYVYLNTDET